MLAASEGTSRAAFNKLVEDSNADRDPLSNETRRVFWNYLEYWEHLQTRDDEITAWLRQNYIGMRLLDEVDDGENETRHIYGIIFHTRRPKGYRVLTGLIKSNGTVDKSSNVVQDYDIRHLHDLIRAGLNPKYRFEDAVDIPDAASFSCLRPLLLHIVRIE